MNINIFRKLLIKITFFLVALMSFSQAHAVISPGSACAPATLGQALNLGFTTNQFGVSNPGPGSFFVVCPIHAEEDDTYSRVYVGMEYTSASGGTTNCAIRLADFDNDDLNGVPLTISSGSAGYRQASADITIFVGNQTNSTIVCPLQAGETLIWYGLDD